MSDLSERLLKQAEAWDGEPGNLLEEAADEIASLRAQRASERKEVAGEIERLRQLLDRTTSESLRVHTQLASARKALERCRTVMCNMALENTDFLSSVFQRWPISHEPLRADARNLLPVIEAALTDELREVKE